MFCHSFPCILFEKHPIYFVKFAWLLCIFVLLFAALSICEIVSTRTSIPAIIFLNYVPIFLQFLESWIDSDFFRSSYFPFSFRTNVCCPSFFILFYYSAIILSEFVHAKQFEKFWQFFEQLVLQQVSALLANLISFRLFVFFLN